MQRTSDSKTRVAWATDPVWYTAMFRRKGQRRYYRCGYRSQNIEEIRAMVYDDIRSGRCASAKIVNWSTEECIEKVM